MAPKENLFSTTVAHLLKISHRRTEAMVSLIKNVWSSLINFSIVVILFFIEAS